MSRFDKYDPVSGGFRALLADDSDVTASTLGVAIGVGLDTDGHIVNGAGTTGVVGIYIRNRATAAGNVADVMTDGEVVEFGGNAGSVYYAHATTGVISTTPSIYRVGHTVEDGRLVVRFSTAGSSNVVGDQTTIVVLTNSTGNTPDNTIEAVTPASAAAGEATAADLTTTNAALLALENNASDLAGKVNEIRTALVNSGLIA
jgi:hypothetical protein